MKVDDEQERKTVEAYRLLQSNNQLELIHNIRKLLAKTSLFKDKKGISSFIFGKDNDFVELTARQYLMIKFVTLDLNEKMLNGHVYNTKFDHSLPLFWGKVLKKNGQPVNIVKSRIKFGLFILAKYLNDIRHCLVIILSSFYSRKKDIRFSKKFVEFNDIATNCLPAKLSDNDYTIINWYINWKDKVPNFEAIHHNVSNRERFNYKNIEIVPSTHFIRYISDIRDKCRLTLWFIAAIFISFYHLLFGRWINALLLHDAFLSRIVQIMHPQHLAKEYLFSISTFPFRPLWTYYAERKGAIITNYSYASSFQGFKNPAGYLDQEYIFETTTWPRLLYWTDPYVTFLRSVVPSSVEVKKVTPIHFSDFPFDFSSIPGNCISVFDVSPVGAYQSAIRIPDSEYRNVTTAISFLKDIQLIAAKYKLVILWKRKRQFSDIHIQAYIDFCDEFSNEPNIITIPPEVSAFSVIQHSRLTISIPFTSTAFIAEHFNIPSAYYDPLDILYNDDRGTQGVSLLKGKVELENWIKIKL